MAAAIKFVDGQVAGGCERVAAITTPELVYGTLDTSSQGIIEGERCVNGGAGGYVAKRW